VDSLRQRIERDIYDLQARQELAAVLCESSDIEARREAVEALQQAIQLDEDDSELWVRLARLQLRRGFEQESRRAYNRAIELAPDSLRHELWGELAQHHLARYQRTQRLDLLRTAEFANQVALGGGQNDPAALRVAIRIAAMLNDPVAMDSLAVRWNHVEPANPWPYMVRGYLMAEEEAWTLAEEAFEKGFARMTEEERKPFLSLSIVDPKEEEKKLLSPDTTRFVEDFWRWRDPSPADEINPARLEFYRRLVQADLLFALDPLGLRGWDHAPGRMLVRYGTPRRWGYRQFVSKGDERRFRPTSSFAAPTMIVAYGRDVEPIFFQFVDFNLNGRFIHPVKGLPRGEDYWIAAEPSVFISPFPGEELDQTVELWRFVDLEGVGTIEVAVALDPRTWPSDLLEEPYRLSSRVVAYDPRWDVEDASVGTWANFETDEFGRLVGVFRLDGSADSVIVGWETSDRSEEARSVGYSTLPPLPGGASLRISDLAFLSRISFEPGQGSYARAYGGGLPNPGHLYRSGDPIAIHFRAYGFETNESGRLSARLTVTVGRRTSGGLFNVLLGRGQDPPAASLVFGAEESGSTLEQLLALDVPPLDPGDYELTVVVEDLASGRTRHRTGSFRVLPPGGKP